MSYHFFLIRFYYIPYCIFSQEGNKFKQVPKREIPAEKSDRKSGAA